MNLKLDEFILINHNDLLRVNISCVGIELSPKSQIDKVIKSLRVSLIQLKANFIAMGLGVLRWFNQWLNTPKQL